MSTRGFQNYFCYIFLERENALTAQVSMQYLEVPATVFSGAKANFVSLLRYHYNVIAIPPSARYEGCFTLKCSKCSANIPWTVLVITDRYYPSRSSKPT